MLRANRGAAESRVAGAMRVIHDLGENWIAKEGVVRSATIEGRAVSVQDTDAVHIGKAGVRANAVRLTTVVANCRGNHAKRARGDYEASIG